MGLKGTDNMAEKARALGAEEVSPARAKEALLQLFRLLSTEPGIKLIVLTPESPMGREVCKMAIKEAGIKEERVAIETIYSPQDPTTPEDTKRFCALAKARNAELILFTGGDGTAKDVVSAVGERYPILGIPSGVKMHSGVFTCTPTDAGNAVLEFLSGRAALEAREVVDLDEDAYREGNIRTRLFGYAEVPATTRLQGCKGVILGVDDKADRESIALGLKEFMDENPGIYILGAGSTLKDIGEFLGLKLTPLGFDLVAVDKGELELLGGDVNEEQILQVLKDFPVERRYLVITPIGAQGFILGRGTQVISDKVLRGLQRENLMVVATPGKLAITPTLRVDTGEFDRDLRGFLRVMTSYRRYAQKKVE